MLVATDLDGSFWAEVDPPATICISGRTWAEYDETARSVSRQMPLYIRGVGESGDRRHAALFKARMIAMLGVARFYEDDAFQADLIRQAVPTVEVVLVEQRERPMYIRPNWKQAKAPEKTRTVWDG